MKHKHEFEAVYHPTPTAEAKALGVKSAEIRKCKTCDKEMIFVLAKNKWFPLFEYQEPEEQGVLLA